MESTAHRAIAIVGAGAVLPEAPNLAAFWENVKNGRYCITEVTPDRWDPERYHDPDPAAPDKTYSKIGGWVRKFTWDPMKWKLPIPPRVAAAMDEAQQWGIACTREALEDYGYPKRPIDLDRTAVILGNAMAGEKHYLTAFRVFFPEYAHELEETPGFAALPESVRREITKELRARMGRRLPEITEDSMPGELANCIAGRIANLYNFHGPNFVTDAACASAMAAITAACEGLIEHDFDYAITGGIDRNMGAPTFVKFCKIGALSPTGSRPYAEGADGFVMGEGAVIFLLKRLADAERDGDKVYAVIRGIAGASDGKGKGITAPNPAGQRICIARAWQNAGLSPATVSLIEGHGTSTKVGDVVEVQSISDVLNSCNLSPGSVALGSVKSNIGHLKGAAGSAGILKAALALHEKILPPSVHFDRPNPDIDFAHSPMRVNTELRPWEARSDTPRRAGVSAFGFGGTNFHAVLEEYVPGRLNGNGRRSSTVSVPAALAHEGTMNAKQAPGVTAVSSSPSLSKQQSSNSVPSRSPSASNWSKSHKSPLRGALVIGAASQETIIERLRAIHKAATEGHAPAPAPPAESDLRARERVAIDYGNAAELADKCSKALKAFAANQPPVWKALRAQGVFRGQGVAPNVAFLYTGQGSQYVNMMKSLRAIEPIVAETFTEADQALNSLLGRPLSEFIFVDKDDPAAIDKAEKDLRQTAITQPAVLATDISMTRLLAAYGIRPNMTMGHSLGEYGALVAAGALPYEDALEAVSARGREMTRVSMADNGRMAAVLAPLSEIERIVKTVNGYLVIANINSARQAVIGGTSKAVEEAVDLFVKAGYTAIPLPVSHAFHTSIVAPASEPLRKMLQRLRLRPPQVPIVANVDGEFYPMGPDVVPHMLDILAQQVAAPVQFVKGLHTLYQAGARVFVETGPKKALHGFVEDVLGDRGDVLALFTNHPKLEDTVAFNQALCGLYSSGLGHGVAELAEQEIFTVEAVPRPTPTRTTAAMPVQTQALAAASEMSTATLPKNGDRYTELGRIFAEAIERGSQILGRQLSPKSNESVVITGAALGLPGTDHIFDESNIGRILRGEQFITEVPQKLRQAMLDKNITRLIKSDNGGPVFESISNLVDVIKLAGRGGNFDLASEFGVAGNRSTAALDRVSALAIAAGIDAMRDAGIPLVMRYKTTTKGTRLPDRWGLPDAMRDDTGVIFASAFPGYNAFADEMERHYADMQRRQELATLQMLRVSAVENNGQASSFLTKLDSHIQQLRAEIEEDPYTLDRRFLFRVLSMGHSQFAELIGARGPNTQLNSACATTTQAIAVAEDWINAGRCRRVIILSADDVTSDHLMHWMGAGFLASGAAATDDRVEEAAIPFDKRRHGMIVGMGAAAMVVESCEAARERGVQPICEVLSSVTANSAFHGSRLDVQHISAVMEKLMQQAESRFAIERGEIAPHAMFMSHETYTPARGGSASAEVFALRQVFGSAANKVVIANTKGFTGHAMATGIEDVVAIKALETGIVPPVANFKEVDPELGQLNLSKGGQYPVEYAVRLGAGFGSQISMVILRWVKTKDAVRRTPAELGYAYRIVDPTAWNSWLTRMSGTTSPELEVVQHTLRVYDETAARMNESLPEPKVMAARASAASSVQQPVTTAEVEVTPAEPVAPRQQPENVSPVLVSSLVPARAQSASPTLTATQRAAVIEPVPALGPGIPDLTADHDCIKEKVLALVAEKTGYPIDMLDLDLDLEADLGIDTVKQAEVFATIRQAYGIVRDDKTRLRDFPTLAHVIRFVEERLPKVLSPDSQHEVIPDSTIEAISEPAATKPEAIVAPGVKVAAAVTPATASTFHTESVEERILSLVVEKTGYPKNMLDLDLDLEADLGVDTVKQAEMFAAIREIYGIPRDPDLKLRDFPTLAHVIQFVFDRRPELAQTPAATAPVEVAPATPPCVSSEEPGFGETSVPAAPIAAAQPATSAGSLGTEPTDTESVKERILALVIEKTGYPKDMLDLELDLEADLGVDTVKQAEMFAAIREIYDIARDPNLKLRDFPTLAHVIQFVYDRRPELGANSQEASSVTTTPATVLAPEPTLQAPTAQTAVTDANSVDVKEQVLSLVVEKTGYPKDMLDLELDLEADLGVDTVKQAEMFAAIRATYNIPRDPNLKLRDFPTLAHVIQFVYDRRPDLAQSSATAPNGVEAAGPVKQAIVDDKPGTAAATETEVPAAATGGGSVSNEEIKNKVLDIVAAKTGYPKDMLDLELDLEADLGVDTVKQAEMFAEVRATYNIPRDPNLKLRDFPTLAHVIQFAKEKLQSAGPIPEGVQAAAPPADAAQRPEPTRPKVARTNLASFDATNSIPRRVPLPVPRPPLTKCKKTGVTLDAKKKRIVIMADATGAAMALAERLRAMPVELLFVENAAAPDTAFDKLKTFVSAGPVHGVYWLPALDHEGGLQSMDFTAWKAAVNRRLKMLYASMRLLYDQIAGPGAFFVSAVRLGGQHGYDENGAVAPMGGAVVGFTKTYKRERPDALVKAVDFEADATAVQIADQLIAETMHDPGAVEIGYKCGQRWTIGLKELPAADGQSGLVLDENTVFVVTGAAGSIVSAITADLAAASGGTFYLLDLVPEPDPSNPDLKRFVEDKDGLKRELFTRIQARGERATPALVEKELAALERAHAANSAIQAVRAAGGTAHYISVNLTDSEAVSKAIAQVRERSGRIDVLLHAAGMERSHFLPDKPQNEFDLIFDVKSDGWFNLLHAIGDMPLGATVAFSSIAGRFGNAGQTDYSSANDLLCKITSSFRNARPNTRGIVIDWTAWGGIGMATRGSIPKMMEVAGIDMLPPEAGIPLIRRELTMGGTRGEVVIGKRLGVLLNEFDATGGLDIAAVAPAVRGPMVDRVLAAGIHSGMQVEVTLDPKVQPFLYDHQIEGTPVLPGVMGIEAFAETALCMLPGWHVQSVEEINFLAPFKFYRKEPRTVTVHATLFAEGEDVVAECELIGKRQLSNQTEPQITTHFTGRVRLTRQEPEMVNGSVPRAAIASVIKPEDIYRIYFHGPAYQVIERAWREGNKVIGKMADNLLPNHQPTDLQTAMAPRLVELCFQTAGLWELGVEGQFGLPRALESVCVSGDPIAVKGALYAIVTPIPDKGTFDAEVVNEDGVSYVRITGYRTVALPSAVDAEPLKALRAAA